MTPFNDAGVTEATVSVRVLTVDGTRRMSHRFFKQVPVGTFFAGGSLADDARPWGFVRDLDYDCDLAAGYVIVGARGDVLIRMTRNEAARLSVRDLFDALIADLPQLYLGG